MRRSPVSRPKLAGSGSPAKGSSEVTRASVDGAVDEALEASGRQIAGGGGCGARAEKDAQSRGA